MKIKHRVDIFFIYVCKNHAQGGKKNKKKLSEHVYLIGTPEYANVVYESSFRRMPI